MNSPPPTGIGHRAALAWIWYHDPRRRVGRRASPLARIGHDSASLARVGYNVAIGTGTVDALASPGAIP